MLSTYDYAVIAVYFAFLVAIGAAFHRVNRSTNEFFRGGGKVLWWIVGATAFMTQFSAWTFTGAASKAYENGALVLVIYAANAIAFFGNFAGVAARLRRMRVITTFEGIRQRWSRGNEQFFTWLQLPIGILTAGISLNGLGVILAAVFGLDIRLTMLAAGLIVIFMATFGGAWAATAGDFMQMLVLMAVTTAAAFLAVHKVGGVDGFLQKLPEQSFTWGDPGRPSVLTLWVIAMVISQLFTVNNISDGYRYLCAKDDRHATRGALLAAVLFLVGPILWFLPPMVAKMLYPDLTTLPLLQSLGAKANDGAYLAVSVATMPSGMLGLMVTALFAATISNMDTGLNKNTGIFIRSFYHPLLRPQASERELMIASRTATIVFGGTTVLAAFAFNAMPGLSLFQIMQSMVSLVTMPVAVPLLLGLFVRRTPPWSGWSTVIVCFLTSLLIANLPTFLGPDAYSRVLPLGAPLAAGEKSYVLFVLGVVANTVVGTLWFLGTTWWYRRQPAAYHAAVDRFFVQINTPVDHAAEEGVANDTPQFTTLGRLCLCYGAFVALLALIPNPPLGRACFLFIGGAIGGIGGLLLRTARRRQALVSSPQAH